MAGNSVSVLEKFVNDRRGAQRWDWKYENNSWQGAQSWLLQ